MKLKLAIDGFLVRCRVHGLAASTIQSYTDILHAFVRFSGNIEVEELSLVDVDQYTLFLQERRLSPATIATHIRHIKAFLNWLIEERHMEPLSRKIKIPKAPKKLVRIYTAQEIIAIFNAIEVGEEWLRLRNCLMISLMLDSGIRQNEVCLIQMNDINMQDGLLKVHGKGSKERIVPIGKTTLHYLLQYRKKCPYELKKYLLLTKLGNAMSKNTIKLFVQKIQKKIPFEMSCHKLRHNFATNYCLDQYEKYGTVDIYKLMVLMGHEDTKTTRIYLHIANQIIASKSNISHLDKVFS